MATVAVLDIALRAKTDKFRKGMKKATTTLGRFKSAVGKIIPLLGPVGLAGAALAAGAAFKRLVIGSFVTLDALGKMSDRLGIATGDLVALQLAAEITGVSIEGMEKSLEQLVRRLGEAASRTSELTPTLAAMNLKATELIRKSPAEVFGIIADKIAAMSTQAEKAEVAYRFFGRQGVKLINTLELGSEGLATFRREAERTGLIVSRDMALKIEEANDAITLMKRSFEGLGRTLAVTVAPGIKRFASNLEDIALGIRFATEDLKKFLGLTTQEIKLAPLGPRTRQLNIVQQAILQGEKKIREEREFAERQRLFFFEQRLALQKKQLARAREIAREVTTPFEELISLEVEAIRIRDAGFLSEIAFQRFIVQLTKKQAELEDEMARKRSKDSDRQLKAAKQLATIQERIAEKLGIERQAKDLDKLLKAQGATLDRAIGTFRQVNLERIAIGGISPKRQKQLVEDPQIRRTNELLIAIRNSVAGGNLAGARTV